MKYLKLLLASLSVLFIATPALAATIKVGESVTVAETTTDDTYVGGSQIFVNEKVGSDLIAVGGTLVVNADVAADALIAGGNVTINGNIGDDLRVAGGSVTINGNVADDVLVAGGMVTLGKDATVGGDLLMAGGALVLDGTVKGAATISGGQMILNGTLTGKTKIQTEQLTLNGALKGDTEISSTKIILGPAGAISGAARYWTVDGQMEFSSVLKGGTATYDSTLEVKDMERVARPNLLAVAATWLVVYFLGAALVLLLIVVWTHSVFDKAAERFGARFWMNFGMGLAFFIVLPVVSAILLVTVIGTPLGFFGLFAFGLSLYLSKILTALILAKWIALKSKKTWGKVQTYFVALGLLLAMQLIAMIPFVGWIAGFVLVPTAFGALLSAKHELYKKIG